MKTGRRKALVRFSYGGPPRNMFFPGGELPNMTMQPFTYDKKEHLVSGRKNQIKVENLSPRLSEDEFLEQQANIVEELVRLFRDYL